MKKIWLFLYTWPQDVVIYGTAFYNRFGNAWYLVPQNEKYKFVKIPFTNVWMKL